MLIHREESGHGWKTCPGASPEVKDIGLLALALLVKAVGDVSGSRLDDSENILESWDDAGNFGGLALEVIEVLKTKTE